MSAVHTRIRTKAVLGSIHRTVLQHRWSIDRSREHSFSGSTQTTQIPTVAHALQTHSRANRQPSNPSTKPTHQTLAHQRSPPSNGPRYRSQHSRRSTGVAGSTSADLPPPQATALRSTSLTHSFARCLVAHASLLAPSLPPAPRHHGRRHRRHSCGHRSTGRLSCTSHTLSQYRGPRSQGRHRSGATAASPSPSPGAWHCLALGISLLSRASFHRRWSTFIVRISSYCRYIEHGSLAHDDTPFARVASRRRRARPQRTSRTHPP